MEIVAHAISRNQQKWSGGTYQVEAKLMLLLNVSISEHSTFVHSCQIRHQCIQGCTFFYQHVHSVFRVLQEDIRALDIYGANLKLTI